MIYSSQAQESGRAEITPPRTRGAATMLVGEVEIADNGWPPSSNFFLGDDRRTFVSAHSRRIMFTRGWACSFGSPGRIGSSARQLTCRRARTTFFPTPMVRTLILATPLESEHR